jgi:hypothetical protein
MRNVLAALLFTSLAAPCLAEPPSLGPAGWKGGTLDATQHRVWPQSICWKHAQSTSLGLSFRSPQDWTAYGAIALWLHSEKATGSRFVIIFPSENPQTEGSDYYSWQVTLDWTGWKRLVLPLAELGRAREPLGWKHITGIRFTAAGYGNTPDPRATVHLDGVELLTGAMAGRQMTDAELFDNLQLDAPALAAVKQCVAVADLAGAKRALAAHLRQRTTPRWTVDWRQPAFRQTRSRPNSRALAAAEKVLRHQFDYTLGPGKKGTIDFGAKIDWTANPTQGEARTHLWNESLNRHFHFRTLAQAYWQTGNDRYAREIADEWLDWTRSNPPVLLSSGNHMANGCEAWQTLTTGIRLADTWPTALYHCLGSPAIGDEALVEMMKSVCQQVRHLDRWPSTGNWLTAESNGMFTAGVLFPEFREARQWRRTALARLYQQLDDEVYPDGMQFELAGGYNNWVVTEFADVLALADLNGLRGELPADYLAKMEKMFNYLLGAAMPNGQIPGLNDSNNADVRKLLATGFELFPRRADFQFVATDGKRGQTPTETSRRFPYTGHCVLRSGWDTNATYLLFDAGPFGAAHQHEDKLHFVLWAHGRQLLLDPGNFSYDHSRWRRYVLSTAGHNTVLVDGEGQHRAGKKELNFWPRPWKAPAPAGSGIRWTWTPEYDLAIGTYSDGYGPHNEIAVTHQRRIVFLKRENLIVVSDLLTPHDKARHRYETLFHLDSDKAAVDPATKAVRSDNPGAANVSIIPSAGSQLSAIIVQGKEDEPVQGWAGPRWHAIPTAVYARSASGPASMDFVLEPTPKGAVAKVVRVEQEGRGVRISLAGGRRLSIVPSGDDRLIVNRSGE